MLKVVTAMHMSCFDVPKQRRQRRPNMIRFKKAIGIKCRELSREIEQNNILVGAVAFSFTKDLDLGTKICMFPHQIM